MFSPPVLSAAPKALPKAGYSLSNANEAVYAFLHPKEAGYSLSEMPKADYLLSNANEAGYSLSNANEALDSLLYPKEAGLPVGDACRSTFWIALLLAEPRGHGQGEQGPA